MIKMKDQEGNDVGDYGNVYGDGVAEDPLRSSVIGRGITGDHLIGRGVVAPVHAEAVKDFFTDAGEALRGTREQHVALQLRRVRGRLNRDHATESRLEAQLMGMRRLREELPTDPCEDNDLLVIERTLENSAGIATGPYRYVALRVNGRYYVTGSGMSDRYTWRRLVEWLGGDAVSITRVKAKTVEGSGKKLL